MAYRAEIEIGVKGVKDLDRFQSQLERLSNEVDRVNKKKFTVANLSSYNEALRKANESLNQTEIETNKAGKATGLYKKNLDSFVTALLASNDAQDLNNKLVRQEIQDRGAATQALKAYNAELASATQRGSQTTMAGSYLRGQPKFGPEPAPDFNPVAGAARTRAAALASEAIAKGRATEKLAQKEIELVGKVNQADRRAFIELNNDKIRGIQKRLDAEIDGIGTKLSAAIKADNAEGAKFDQELARRIRVTTEAEKIYLQIREDSEKRIEARRKAGLAAAKKLENDIAQQKSDRATRRNNAISSGLIGGAFPLLFGQGGGAAIGGGIGGFAGGMIGGQMGFALSLVGTQFGAFADQIVSGGATLGQALNPLTADIDALAEAAGFAGTETGAALQAIEQLGTQQQALKAATALLAATVGNEGVDALNSFGAETADLGNEFARAMTQMQTAAARFFAGIPGFIANALKAGNDLQAGLNLDTPEADKLKNRRSELRGVSNDVVQTAAPINLSEKDLKELISVEERLRNLGADTVTEAQRQVKLTAEELQHKTLLQQLGVKDSKLQEIETKLAGVRADYTDKNFVSLTRQAIIREADIEREKAIEIIGRDENGNIKDRAALLIKNGQIAQKFISRQADLTLKVNKALESRDKKLARKTSRETSRTGKQAEQARALTANLERQLAQSKVAGTVQAQKLAIEGRYEQTLERIAKLDNQSDASRQRKLAEQIKTTAEAKLAFDQEQKRTKALRDAVAPLLQIRASQEANLAASREYNRLIMEGMLPAEAKRITEFNKQVSLLLQQKDIAIDLLQIDIDRAKLANQPTEDMQKRLDDLKKGRVAIEGEAAKGPGEGKSNMERLKDEIAAVKKELNELLDPVNQVVGAAGAIGDAFSESFRGVIDGSMTAQEALANLFQRTADHFLDMTAQIIAAAIKMQAIQFVTQIIGSMAGAAASGGGAAAATPASKAGTLTTGPLPDLGSGPSFGSVNDFKPATILPAQKFAEGGFVSSPTRALVGEGGEPEYIIPASKMRESMARYSRGSRGGGVIPANGGGGGMQDSGGGVATSAPIDVRYTVERINSVDYVTADQFQNGMQSAAAQGAQRGEQNTLKRLQMSGSTRKRLGL